MFEAAPGCGRRELRNSVETFDLYDVHRPIGLAQDRAFLTDPGAGVLGGEVAPAMADEIAGAPAIGKGHHLAVKERRHQVSARKPARGDVFPRHAWPHPAVDCVVANRC